MIKTIQKQLDDIGHFQNKILINFLKALNVKVSLSSLNRRVKIRKLDDSLRNEILNVCKAMLVGLIDL